MGKELRFGVIGVGGMGGFHADYLLAGKIRRARLTAVCDVVPSQMERFGAVKRYEDAGKLIKGGEVDAVIIATPHYGHTTFGIAAMDNGLHLLTEKPISVHKADAQRLIDAHKRNKKTVFGAMFQMRTAGINRKIKSFVDSGELGEIRRVIWIITDWFRTEAYYASGGWRATWKGEGGGVLLNQCPHNIDLLQWVVGMPSAVRANCYLGKYHDIEVEDDVTAFLEYPNGATGLFVTTTGETPGTNRWEIDGERGKLVIEHGKLSFTRNEVPMSEFRSKSKESFANPAVWQVDIPYQHGGGGHMDITNNFVEAILDKKPLFAPGEEGIKGVELANCMLYSSFTGTTVKLPLDAAAYEARLKDLIAKSKFKKKGAGKGKSDITSSFK